MKTITKEFYVCEICGEEYGSKKEALACEKKPLSKDSGIKVGDTVIVRGGQGDGERGVVEKVWIYDKSWGHYAWERYWHTPGYSVKMNGWGSRQCSWDGIELAK